MFTIINSLPGRTVSTPPRKGVDYGVYKQASFGPAVGFLPIPPNMGRMQLASTSSLDSRHYEPYFQHHLHEESDAVRITFCSSRPKKKKKPPPLSQKILTGSLKKSGHNRAPANCISWQTFTDPDDRRGGKLKLAPFTATTLSLSQHRHLFIQARPPVYYGFLVSEKTVHLLKKNTLLSFVISVTAMITACLE